MLLTIKNKLCILYRVPTVSSVRGLFKCLISEMIYYCLLPGVIMFCVR